MDSELDVFLGSSRERMTSSVGVPGLEQGPDLAFILYGNPVLTILKLTSK